MTKIVKDLYDERYETLLREIKALHEWCTLFVGQKTQY